MKNEWSDLSTQIKNIDNEVLTPKLTNIVKKYAKGSRLFDYGCGWGDFADLIQKEGFSVTAFDEADEMIDQARSKFLDPKFLYKHEFDSQRKKLKGQFDIVVSSLVLCILEGVQQNKLLDDIKFILQNDGEAIISFCHPCFDYMPDSLISTRKCSHAPIYSEEFQYEKELKDKSAKFHDFHRPLEYYSDLFREHGLNILEIGESDVMKTSYFPDFIIFVLSKA